MSGFIEWLEGSERERHQGAGGAATKPRLRPWEIYPAYPYVEPFVKNETNSWRREMHYLVAGLWAAHWREGQLGQPMSIREGMRCLRQRERSMSRMIHCSTERRFITLLDSDSDQLPHRLRQMIALLKSRPSTSTPLLTGLLYWNDDQKRTQNAWARDFYRNMNHETETESTSQEEKRHMKTLIEIHALQNFAPSNLNRDDTGAPKDALFGGTRRARVSSQCRKRAVREYFKGRRTRDGSPIERTYRR